MLITTRLLPALALLGCPAVLFAQSEPATPMKKLMAARASTPIVLDGRLDEPAWANAAVIEAEDLHQILPVEYSMPVLMLSNQEATYCLPTLS